MKNILKIFKMKGKLVKLVVSGIEGIKLHTGTVKEIDGLISIRQVIAGSFTDNIFYFKKNLRKSRKIDRQLNYYIDEADVHVKKYKSK